MTEHTRNHDASIAEQISHALIAHAGPIAESCGAAAIFVYADVLGDRLLPTPPGLEEKVYYISKTAEEQESQEERGTRFLRVPNVPLTRTGQVKIAVFLALSRGIVRRGDVVVCLSGLPNSGGLDSLFITQVGREFEMYSTSEKTEAEASAVRPEVIERVVNIAMELGYEGREGKPVGALFVIGDTERVLSMSRQLILNPFRGYPEEERNVLDPALEETVKELSTIDGAFLIRGDGVIETCGTFLKVTGQDEFELPQGLGARHHAAAGITAVTNAFAVTVSESTGTVTIFRDGRIMTEIEKPRRLDVVHRPFRVGEE